MELRGGFAARRGLGWRGRWLAVGICGGIYQILELFTGFEIRDALGGYFHASSGLGVASHARLPLPCAETPEPSNFDLIPRTQRLYDAVEDGFHDYLGILTGHFHN